MTTREAMHRFLVLFVDVEKRDEAEECLSLLLEVAATRGQVEVRSELVPFLQDVSVNDTVPAPPPDVCSVHDLDDVVPGRICGRHLPCKEHNAGNS